MRPDHLLGAGLPAGPLLVDDDGVRHLHVEPTGPSDPLPQIHVLEEHEVVVVEALQAPPGGGGQQQAGPREPAHRPRPARTTLIGGVIRGGEGVGRPDPAQDGVPGALDQGGQGAPGGVDGAVGVEQERPQAAGRRVGQARINEDVETPGSPDEIGIGHHDPVLLQIRGRQVGARPVTEVGAVPDDARPVPLSSSSDDVVLGAVVRDDDDEPARRRRGQGGQEALQLLTRVEGDRHHSHALLIGREGPSPRALPYLIRITDGSGRGTGRRGFGNTGHGQSLAPLPL